MLFFCGTLSSQDTSDPIPSYFEPSWIDFLNFIPSLKLVGRSAGGEITRGKGGSWKWSNVFFEEICLYACCREKNDWSSCFGSVSTSFLFVGFLISEIDFVFFFFGLHFLDYHVGRGIFIDSVSLHPFFFLFLDADRILESILFSLSPFFCSIAEFLQFYVFGGENWAFFRSFVAGFDGRIDFIAKRGMKWNSWELRPDGSRFLSHFWKEIRAE